MFFPNMFHQPGGTTPMNSEEVVKRLKSQSTLRLFLLSTITLGIYTAHYIRRQTTVLNEALAGDRRIPEGLVSAILFLAYAAVAFMILFLVEDRWLLQAGMLGDLLNVVWSILVVVWALMARNRMNELLCAAQGREPWFHGLWTCLLTTFYFNFKINTLNENLAACGLPQDPIHQEET
jgi:ABC-type Mn2+/Zn2+ transport system permease subunit